MDLRGIKNADLSRQTGISIQRIGHYVQGRYMPKKSVICAIAKILCVNPAWLAGYDVYMFSNSDIEKKKNIDVISCFFGVN